MKRRLLVTGAGSGNDPLLPSPEDVALIVPTQDLEVLSRRFLSSG